MQNLIKHYSQVVTLAVLSGIMVAAGCTGGTTSVNVAKFIQNETPTIEAAATTIATAVATLAPADALLANAALATFNASFNTLDAVAKAYVANPSASALTNLENALVAIQNSVGTTLTSLGSLGISAVIIAELKNAVNIGTTVALAILGAVQSISTKAQLDNYRAQEKVTVASLRPYIDLKLANNLALQNHVTVDDYFQTAAASGI